VDLDCSVPWTNTAELSVDDGRIEGAALDIGDLSSLSERTIDINTDVVFHLASA